MRLKPPRSCAAKHYHDAKSQKTLTMSSPDTNKGQMKMEKQIPSPPRPEFPTRNPCERISLFQKFPVAGRLNLLRLRYHFCVITVKWNIFL